MLRNSTGFTKSIKIQTTHYESLVCVKPLMIEINYARYEHYELNKKSYGYYIKDLKKLAIARHMPAIIINDKKVIVHGTSNIYRTLHDSNKGLRRGQVL